MTSKHVSIKQETFEFLTRNKNMEDLSVSTKIIKLIEKIYSPENEEYWLVSAVPLILSLNKKTSNYNNPIFFGTLNDHARWYDIELRNF
jgi:hypothetical protein